MSESADLGAEWGSQAKKDHDDHLNNPTNVAIREATALKEKGNTDFGREAFDDAVSAYSAGAAAAARVEGNYRAKVANDLQTACLCNAAQARLKQERWPEAAELCTRALAVDGKCVKALFRRGCAQLALKDYEKARRDLALAAELEPSNKSITSKARAAPLPPRPNPARPVATRRRACARPACAPSVRCACAAHRGGARRDAGREEGEGGQRL